MPGYIVVKALRIALSRFAKHPATGLVHEVVGMLHHDVAEGIGVFKLTFTDECKGRDDSDAVVP